MYNRHIQIPERAAELAVIGFALLRAAKSRLNWCITHDIRLEKAGAEYPDTAGGLRFPARSIPRLQ